MHKEERFISIKNATANNLKGISLKIPHQKLIVVTGVSGSGKSSLVFDIIAREGQRRFFETFPSFSRQFLGKLTPAQVEKIDGLSPVISIGQKTTGGNIRSTVGTMSDIYDWLRLLYARTGEQSASDQHEKLTRSHFSFNSDLGKCLRCQGIGKEEQIDLQKLITDANKTIRQGVLAPTLPNGYIMYSQVTLEVLNTVCKAEGFDIDIPWNELTEAQQHVILHGSTKIKVPFGKHSLESRLKWTGIKAKPREEGHYKGMIPIMSEILRRDRNANILKYVSAVTCPDCHGTRLNKKARNVTVHAKKLPELLEHTIAELVEWIKLEEWGEIDLKITEPIHSQLNQLIEFGLGHITLNKPATSLTASEAQRIRIANQLLGELSNVLYVFDEPSIGLHKRENASLLNAFRQLVNRGNTVLVVEHDFQTILSTDWIIDIGPKAGNAGGTLLYNGTLDSFLKEKALRNISPTYDAITTKTDVKLPSNKKKSRTFIHYQGCLLDSKKELDLSFQKAGLNVISGTSGSGKSTFIQDILLPSLHHHLSKTTPLIPCKKITGLETIQQFILIDQTPIGRTPRSNPATYLGLSDHLRDLFSKLPEAKEEGLKKSHFSFNTKGGRCETCMGAGKTQIGMHFLGQVDLICETCNGKRFNERVQRISYRQKSITDIYALSITEAALFFKDQPKLHKTLILLCDIGLGYLSLGQSSTTLSGGEAQRIKIVNQLQKKTVGETIYVMRDPSIGLHASDIKNLLLIFDAITSKGNTIICTEQDEQIIHRADQFIALSSENNSIKNQKKLNPAPNQHQWIQLNGVTTHLLKSINVRFPKDKITVVTGLSGSGKSSLVYDTLHAEAQSRFSASLSTYARTYLKQQNRAKIKEVIGLTPTIAIGRQNAVQSKRSTVATISNLHPLLRLLYSRISQLEGHSFSAHDFSFHHLSSTCKMCLGEGVIESCDPKKIIHTSSETIYSGAFTTNKALSYYTDPQGQFMATLEHVASEKGLNLSQPWEDMSSQTRNLILFGTGNLNWDITWNYKTKTREGQQSLSTTWKGFCNYISEEFHLRKHNKNKEHLEALVHDQTCSSCKGYRLNQSLLSIQFSGKNIGELTALSISELEKFLKEYTPKNKMIDAITNQVIPPILSTTKVLQELGLGYLTMDRITKTLSGGEYQRLRLAGLLRGQLFGVTYLLDEPSVGLDDENKSALLQCLENIRQAGNTIIMIEHDREIIQSADYIVEMGPHSGTKGGELIFQGELKDLKKETITWELLHKPKQRRPMPMSLSHNSFGIKKAFLRNLNEANFTFQTNRINVITGKSGSGKSTLMREVIYASAKDQTPIGCQEIIGFDHFDSVHLMNQEPIRVKKMMTVASYTGIMEILKKKYAIASRENNFSFKRSDFSYSSKIGRCSHCYGAGSTTTELDFTGAVTIPCPVCKGKRYNLEIQHVRIDNHSIADVLALTIAEAMTTLKWPELTEKLSDLIAIGIGHLPLGQESTFLSGGEAQRLKLADNLNNLTGKKLFLFDEPSIGLHSVDLENLIALFEKLIHEGHTVVFIEHHRELIDIAHCEVKLGN